MFNRDGPTAAKLRRQIMVQALGTCSRHVEADEEQNLCSGRAAVIYCDLTLAEKSRLQVTRDLEHFVSLQTDSARRHKKILIILTMFNVVVR